MVIKVCSAYSDKELEQKMQSVTDEGQARGYALKQVCYSTSYNSGAVGHTYNKDNFFRSAIMLFDSAK